MALRTVSSIATATSVFWAAAGGVPAIDTASVSSLEAPTKTHFVSSIHDELIQEFSFFPVSNKKEDQAKGEAIWRVIEPLFGIWADNEEIDDNWLDNLRAASSRRLRDLYATESD